MMLRLKQFKTLIAQGVLLTAAAVTLSACSKAPESAKAVNPVAVLRVDDVTAMRAAVKAGLGVARMPCWVADVCPGLLRLKLDVAAMGWGLWVLIHADLRSTARVRVCRDFLIETLEKKQDLIEGRCSSYV